MCLPKKYGGLGLKNVQLWNTTCIVKLLWQITRKKDMLWIKWIHSRYLKTHEFWSYPPPSECSWYWRKILRIRDHLKSNWPWHNAQKFSVSDCYLWLLGTHPVSPWASAVWSRVATPRYSLIAWVSMHGKIPVLDRLARFSASSMDTSC